MIRPGCWLLLTVVAAVLTGCSSKNAARPDINTADALMDEQHRIVKAHDEAVARGDMDRAAQLERELDELKPVMARFSDAELHAAIQKNPDRFRDMTFGPDRTIMAQMREAGQRQKLSPELLVGTWVVVKADTDTLPVGATVTFAGGVVQVLDRVDDKDKMVQGTYAVAGDVLTLRMKAGFEEEQTIAIKKLTATELTMSDEKQGKTLEFKRTK